ncbi:MAG TPA: PAS domain-containing sensor histidine kinase [Candidatus Kapabacteria bacterium]|nr:PAS domain-containing sensor histidine kinase [Candidatus Kapabacteria bacterium]
MKIQKGHTNKSNKTLRKNIEGDDNNIFSSNNSAEVHLSLDDLPVGIYKSKPDGTIIYANKALVKLAGYESFEELSKVNAFSLYAVPELRVAQTAQFGTTDMIAEEYRFVRKDGSIIWVRDIGKKVLDEDGELYYEGTIEDITERKIAEMRLRESEEKYRELIEKMEEGLALHEIILDDKGNPVDYVFLDVNSAFERLTGLKKEKIIGKRVKEVLPDTEFYWIEKYGDVALNSTVEKFTNYSQELDKYFKVIAFSPRRLQFATLIEDVTEKMIIENALQESELRLRTLINTIPDIITFKDGEGRWIITNDFNLKLFGLENVDYRGKTDAELAKYTTFYEEALEFCIHSDELAWQAGKPSRGDEIIPTPDGGNRIFDVIKIPIIENGERKGLVVVGRDITEKKEFEQMLSETNERYKMISEMITDYVYLVKGYPGDKIDVLWLLGGFEKITGYKLNHYKEAYETILKIIHPEDFKKFNEDYIPRLRNLEEIKAEYRIMSKSGETRWILDHIKPFVKPDEPDVIYQIGAVTDITEKKKYENEILESREKLKEIIDQKDRLFSIIAHDLKGPISAFVGMSKMFSENLNELTLTELQEYTENMHKSASHILELLENLLEWSRVQRGKKQFNPERLNIRLVLKNVADLLINSYKLKEVALNLEIENDAYVFADLQMLNTIFRNLISNALKFSFRGEKVEVRLSEFENKYIVSIKDYGIGMDDELKSKLFNPAEKVSRTGTEEESSTGLGLLLCKEFIDYHKGRIWVESQPNLGSTFFVELEKAE